MNVLFRCDASKEIGFGHLIRCLALGYEFKRKGCNVAFAVNQNATVKKIIQNNQHAIFEKNSKNYKQWFFNTIKKFQTNILILDVRDNLDKQTLIDIKRNFNIKIATIDDPCDKRLVCDYAFYPPVKQVESMDWSGFSGKLYVGFEWVILRRQFLEYAKVKKYPNKPVKILITAGGSDPKGVTLIIAKALNKLDIAFEALIVLGGFFKWKKELNNILKTANYSYSLLMDVDNMAFVMSQCDLAITSFGTSAYELAFLGVPAIYLCISQDHNISASMFEKEGCSINLGIYENANEEKIAKTVLQLAQSSDLIIGMSKKCRQLMDGLGVKRIREVLLGDH